MDDIQSRMIRDVAPAGTGDLSGSSAWSPLTLRPGTPRIPPPAECEDRLSGAAGSSLDRVGGLCLRHSYDRRVEIQRPDASPPLEETAVHFGGNGGRLCRET